MQREKHITHLWGGTANPWIACVYSPQSDYSKPQLWCKHPLFLFFVFLKTWPKLHHTLCAHMNCEAHHDCTKTTGMLNAWNQSVAAGCMWIIETSQWHGVCRSKRHHWCRRWLKRKSSLEQTLTETWSPGLFSSYVGTSYFSSYIGHHNLKGQFTQNLQKYTQINMHNLLAYVSIQICI